MSNDIQTHQELLNAYAKAQSSVMGEWSSDDTPPKLWARLREYSKVHGLVSPSPEDCGVITYPDDAIFCVGCGDHNMLNYETECDCVTYGDFQD